VTVSHQLQRLAFSQLIMKNIQRFEQGLPLDPADIVQM
jgi:hypothetical protein